MWTQLLNMLGWMGLYALTPIVLNEPVGKNEVITPPPQVVAHASALIMNWMIEDYTEDGGRSLAYEPFAQSVMYKRNIKTVFRDLLLNLDPSQLDAPARKAFFINLYNLLTIDAILSLDELPEQTRQVPQFWRRYEYKIGQRTLNLDEIEHGILRGNAPHPGGTVLFDEADPRGAWALPLDPRIHAALNCGAKSCPPLTAFFPSTLEEDLDAAMLRFCAQGVTLETDGSVTINSIFDWYGGDFASDETGVLRWLSECNQNPKIKLALQEAARGIRNYSFSYDWDLNNVPEPTQTSGRVNVHLYMESLCPDTSAFVRYQLHKHWPVLKNMINLTIIPFGKASAIPNQDGGIDFRCQHGRDECHGNIVQSCVVNMFDTDTQVNFINCMFRHEKEAYSGPECAAELGLPWENINACVEGPEGPKLLYNNGVLTSRLKPHLTFVPTVTFDGTYNRRSLMYTLDNFKKEVCKRYNGPEPGC